MILRELREIDQATDDILIYGNDGTTNQKIKTDSTGRPDIVSDNLDVALSTLKSVLDTINANTDTLETKTQSIRDQLDVVLSSRASQATTQSILSALGELSGTDIVNQLQTLSSKDFATENTLIEVRDFLDTVEVKLQSIINSLDVNLSTRSSESTSQEIRDTLGQESGSTVLSRLSSVVSKLEELFDNGIALIKLWDGTNIASITDAGRVKIDTSPPDAPIDTTSVVVTEFGNVNGTDDNTFLIPSGDTLVVQRFSAGAEADTTAGNVIKLFHDPDGDGGVNMQIIDVIFASGSSDQHDLRSTFVGDGTALIRMRRERFSGGSKEIFGRWEGYH